MKRAKHNDHMGNRLNFDGFYRAGTRFILFLALLVISISCFAQSRHVSETTKKIVFTRDGGSCRCCGSVLNLEYDHITPFSCGGGNEVSNIQLLCQKCNRSKSNSCTCKIHNRRVGTNCCDKTTTTKRLAGGVKRVLHLSHKAIESGEDS